jgi:hypothetical protein
MIWLQHLWRKLIDTTADLATESGRRRELRAECDHLQQVVNELGKTAAVCNQLEAATANARSIEGELEHAKLDMHQKRSELDRLRGGPSSVLLA